MKKHIIPAIIAKTQDELEEILDKINDHANLLQLDIMDGKFVPTNSLDFDLKFPLQKYRYEAHLMVANPMDWIKRYGDRVDTIIAHYESLNNVDTYIKKVSLLNKKIALAINPETEIKKILPYLQKLDQVLVMTVHPGYYGSQFLPEMVEKIKDIRMMYPEMDIEVDGGISTDTISSVNEAGANMFVSGSFIIKSDDVKKKIEILKSYL